MTVGKLIEILNNYPSDADIAIYDTARNSEKAYAYFPSTKPECISIKYTALVIDPECGVHKAGNNVYNPFDAPLDFQSSKLVHIRTHYGE